MTKNQWCISLLSPIVAKQHKIQLFVKKIRGEIWPPAPDYEVSAEMYAHDYTGRKVWIGGIVFRSVAISVCNRLGIHPQIARWYF